MSYPIDGKAWWGETYDIFKAWLDSNTVRDQFESDPGVYPGRPHESQYYDFESEAPGSNFDGTYSITFGGLTQPMERFVNPGTDVFFSVVIKFGVEFGVANPNTGNTIYDPVTKMENISWLAMNAHKDTSWWNASNGIVDIMCANISPFRLHQSSNKYATIDITYNVHLQLP